MSAKEGATRLAGKDRSADSTESERLTATKARGTRETRFDSHTQSSLMKRREPRRSSSTKSARGTKRPEVGVAPGRATGGVCKRRSNVARQSRSMQALKTMLKQEKKDRGMSGSFQGELTQAARREARPRAESSSDPPPRDDLLEVVPRDLDGCAGSPPAESLAVRDEPTGTVGDRSEERSAENAQYASHGDDTSRSSVSRDFQQWRSTTSSAACSSPTWTDSTTNNVCDCSENHTPIAGIRPREILQLRSDEDESTDTQSEVEVPRRLSKLADESEKRPTKRILSNEDCSIKIQICRQSVSTNATHNHGCNRKIWTNGRVAIPNGGVNGVDRATCNAMKFVRHVDDNARAKDNRPIMNGDVMPCQRKRAPRKDLVSARQRAWRPTGVNKASTVESTLSLTQKSFRSARSLASTRDRQQNKYSSIERIESFDSESPSASVAPTNRRNKMLMKENRDPRVDRVTKICEHLAQAKQQRKFQSGGTVPKRRRSITKLIRLLPSSLPKASDPKISCKRNDANPDASPRSRSNSRSRSRYWQTRLITPKKYSSTWNGVDRCRVEPTLIYKRRSRPSEVINELREIINSTRGDDSAEESNINNVPEISVRKENDREMLLSTNHDVPAKTSPHNELHLTTIENANTADRSFRPSRRSIGVQTDAPSLSENDFERDLDSTKISKSTRTIDTQTSPRSNDAIEVGCNTVSYNTSCEDTGISCDLIDLTSSLRVDVNPTAIKDKSSDNVMDNVSIHTTESWCVKYNGANTEDECTDHVAKVATPSRTIRGFTFVTAEAESIVCKDEVRQGKMYVISKIGDDWINTIADKRQESSTYFANHDAFADGLTSNPSAEKSCQSSLSLYDYDASCSDNSEDIMEYTENEAQYEDIVVTPELKLKDLPSDVIATFQLAMERTRNLHKAIAIYKESLRSRQAEIRDEEAAEDCETLTICKSQCCIQRDASRASCISESGTTTPERNSKCRFIMMKNENFDGFSTRSSSSSNSVQIYESGKRASKTLALPATEEASFVLVSREHLIPLVYCIVCTVVFWCLQFSFTCDPAA